MKKFHVKFFLFAISALFIASFVSAKMSGSASNTSLVIFSAGAVPIGISLSSILFYLSLNIKSKIFKAFFSLVNVLVFLFITFFILDELGVLVYPS